MTQLCQRHFLVKFDEAIACRELVAVRRFLIEPKNRVCLIIRVPNIELACRRVNDFTRDQKQLRITETLSELTDKFLKNFES